MTAASFIVTSLDGFHADSNGVFDWVVPDDEFNEFASRQLDAADTLAFGRATYEHMAAWWPTEQARINDPAITTRMNSKPKLVFSTTLERADWSNSTLVSADAADRVASAEGDLLIIGSAHLTAQLAAAGVIDELRIMVCPIVLGSGRSLFEDLTARLPLTLLRARPFASGNVLLTYRPG